MRISSVILLSMLSFLATACSPGISTPAPLPASAQSTLTSANTSEPAVFTDPFAYCAAAGTVDAPDERYAGEEVPGAVIDGFKKAAGLEDSSMPVEMFQKSTVWRCMDSKVYACNFGANLPCESRANTSLIPTRAMLGFCKAHPNEDFIPMSETGHDTIYSWRCAGTIAMVDSQIAEVDGAGFIANIWYPIEPQP